MVGFSCGMDAWAMFLSWALPLLDLFQPERLRLFPCSPAPSAASESSDVAREVSPTAALAAFGALEAAIAGECSDALKRSRLSPKGELAWGAAPAPPAGLLC